MYIGYYHTAGNENGTAGRLLCFCNFRSFLLRILVFGLDNAALENLYVLERPAARLSFRLDHIYC